MTLIITLSLTALAEACLRNGLYEEGLAGANRGLDLSRQSGQYMSESELQRLKGELLMTQDSAGEAENCFRSAIKTASGQKAMLLQLRATVSLARLLKQQGRTEEAREMLAEIYNWFTEGFEFADLKDAKALLDELGA